MPILESLAKDHRVLEQLVSELGNISSREPRRRIDSFSRLQALLQGHARAEEEVVYRRLRRQDRDDQALLLEAFEEHHLADVLLQELASACPGGPGWAAKARVLEELLRHHIKEEEVNLFPLITRHFDEATLQTMDGEFQALKHEKLESLLGPLRRATPAFAGRATVTAQAAAGRFVRRGELMMRDALSRLHLH